MEKFRHWIVSETFDRVMLIVILANAATIGLETYPDIMALYGHTLHLLDRVMLWIFVVELGLRYWAASSKKAHFLNGWTWFDIIVVAIAFVPASAGASVARVLRVFRVLRAVSMMPQLRLLVSTLLRSLPSMVNILLLLSVLFYLFGVIGTVLFGQVAPEHFGRLHTTLLTLFGVVTLEGWVEVMTAVRAVRPWAWIYFVSFILLGTFVVINLFVAVVVNNLEKSNRELLRLAAQAQRDTSVPALQHLLQELTTNLHTQADLQKEAHALLEELHEHAHPKAAPLSQKKT